MRVVYKNFLIHDAVRPAHQAGCAAGMQGKFVAFKNAWWKEAFGKGHYDQATIDAVAKSAGLDLAKLHADENSEACKQRVATDQQELEAFHINSTPTFFINGTHLDGAPTAARLGALIDQKLQQAQASGVPCADYYDKVVMAQGLKSFKGVGDAKN